MKLLAVIKQTNKDAIQKFKKFEHWTSHISLLCVSSILKDLLKSLQE